MDFNENEKFNSPDKVWSTVAEVLAKPSWTEDDITVLVNNLDELDEKTLKKLGVNQPE